MSKQWIRNAVTVRQMCMRTASAWALGALCVAVLLGIAPAAKASESRKGDGDHKPMAGMAEEHGGMQQAGCVRDVHLTEEAERQMGGAHYAGAMPAKSKGGMQMGGSQGAMKMGGDKGGMQMGGDKGAMKMGGDKGAMETGGGQGMEMAHQDHDAKKGGVLFMAPNEVHHIEGAYSPDCGFQLYLYNAFTKPINTKRFRAFIKVIGEKDGEYAETYQFLTPSETGSVLQARPLEGMSGELEIELYVQFPGEPSAEVFNFVVDEHGELS